MDYFKLTRNFWDFAFENPEKIKPNHCALYLFIVEHCNRLGWKRKFGLPTTMAKDAIGIRSYNTYINTLNDLVAFELIEMIEVSKNQYSSNIVAISNFDKALDKALDKASIKHVTKQSESNIQSIDSIDKHITNIQIYKEQSFDIFWNTYDKKTDSKKCKDKFLKLSEENIIKILEVVSDYVKSTPDKKFRKNPLTWLNGNCWNDEININLNTLTNGKSNITNTNEFSSLIKNIRSTGERL
jgi:hypothetical protein